MEESPCTVDEVKVMQAAFLEAMESAKTREGELQTSVEAIRARAVNLRRLRDWILAIMPGSDPGS